MSIIKFNSLANAVELAEHAVAQKGEDFVYDEASIGGCVYFHDEEDPACLVGHMLYAKGYKMSDLESLANAANDKSVEYLVDRKFIRCSGKVKDFLNTLQANQDEGCSWGDSLTKAKEMVGWIDLDPVDFKTGKKVKVDG